jgi:hypothetical protein
LFLNTTEANSTSGSTSYWNNTAPDSSVVTLGTNAEVNSGNIIAYMWAESPAQNFGKYSGGNTGTAITCGFEPAFVLIKNATGTADWAIYDNARSTVNPRNNILSPNESIAETGDNSIYDIDFTSTGFTVNATSSVININGDEYIYMAIASAGGASGVVGDITGLDMTLSESSGTWEVGQTVTTDEKPALASTVALNFDANGAVSGIAAGNPGYVNMNSNNPILNFPSTFADGQTPDATIPEGSYIQTEVRAWNAEGESIKKSNKITPTSSVTLSKGETKLIDGYTPVATAHAREVIAEANQIEDQIQRATDNLNIAMANYEEQGKRRSV